MVGYSALSRTSRMLEGHSDTSSVVHFVGPVRDSPLLWRRSEREWCYYLLTFSDLGLYDDILLCMCWPRAATAASTVPDM